MIFISVPSLFLLGYISVNIAKDTLMETNKQTNQDRLVTSSEVADLLLGSVVNLNRAIVWNNQIRNDLRKSNEVYDQYELISIRNDITSQMQRVVNNNFIDASFIESICVFNLNYEANCLGRSDGAGIYEQSANKKISIESTAWYKETVDAEGRVLFFDYNVLESSNRSFSTAKLFRDSDNIAGDRLGIVIVNISKRIFNSIFTSSSNYGGEFLVIDAVKGNQSVVYGDLKNTYDSLREEGYLISEYKNETTGWYFVHLIELKELLKESNKIGIYTTVMASIIALLALTLAYIVSGTISRPLLKIKKMMIDWMKGSRSLEGTFEDDEVGAIGETFKRMVTVNEELNRKLVHSELKEREAELRALQAQIKPHFLYNTLDSIYWMASLENNQAIAQMAVSLSESFKLSLNKGKETIPVYKELKHIEHYITIQNIRYNNRFTYIEEVDPSIKGIEILKLILQPLIENAIYHGLEKKVGPGMVKLTGNLEDGYIRFTVEDDGVGINDIALTEQGYGLRNVKERLLLCYGDSSSLRVSSEPGKGTCVEVRFMLLTMRGDEGC